MRVDIVLRSAEIYPVFFDVSSGIFGVGLSGISTLAISAVLEGIHKVNLKAMEGVKDAFHGFAYIPYKNYDLYTTLCEVILIVVGHTTTKKPDPI